MEEGRVHTALAEEETSLVNGELVAASTSRRFLKKPREEGRCPRGLAEEETSIENGG